MKKLNPRDYDTAEVKRVAFEFVTKANDLGRPWPDKATVTWQVVKVLEPEWYEATKGQWPGDPFGNKVQRVLDQLAAEGKIIKRGGAAAGARTWRNIPRYASPEYAAQYDNQMAEQTEAKRVAGEDFKLLVKRAAHIGVEVGGGPHHITLSDHDMDRIITFFESIDEVVP